jgi:transposase-like protein
MFLMDAKIQNTSTKDDVIINAIPAACANEKAAVEFFEKQRWGNHPACPRCGDLNVYRMMNSKTGERQDNYRWRCRGCKDQFTVRIGTVFEESRIELRHWAYAFWRASTSKKGVSALEIKRHTGLSYKSALFLLNRIRFAMQEAPVTPLEGTVEVDETYVGGKPRERFRRKRGRGTDKAIVLAMVERGGRVRVQPIANIRGETLKTAIRQNVNRSARIMTDEHNGYFGIGKEFAGGHHTVRHSYGEYARGDVSSNTVEGFFSIFKRGINGIYHAVSREHLPKYLSEFQFRYSHRKLSDGERTLLAIRCADGKRLTYKESINVRGQG